MLDNKLVELLKNSSLLPDRPLATADALQILLQHPKAQPRMLEWDGKQILVITLETVASPALPLKIFLSDRNIECLHAVKQFIADSFPKWPGVLLLSRKGEMNDFKLKVGFKHLFNMTAYDYHRQLKFQEAKKLLQENKESIRAIAYLIGYDHHASFTQEFKKQFGYTPSWFKKQGRP
jgi:AraC-like DNA-binding protein